MKATAAQIRIIRQQELIIEKLTRIENVLGIVDNTPPTEPEVLVASVAEEDL